MNAFAPAAAVIVFAATGLNESMHLVKRAGARIIFGYFEKNPDHAHSDRLDKNPIQQKCANPMTLGTGNDTEGNNFALVGGGSKDRKPQRLVIARPVFANSEHGKRPRYRQNFDERRRRPALIVLAGETLGMERGEDRRMATPHHASINFFHNVRHGSPEAAARQHLTAQSQFVTFTVAGKRASGGRK